jgi:hypothetical protein
MSGDHGAVTGPRFVDIHLNLLASAVMNGRRFWKVQEG